MPSKEIGDRWKVKGRKFAFEWTGELEAYWEAHLDPISDDYTTSDISAQELFYEWARRVEREFPNGLVPLYWFVESPSQGKFEFVPFQYVHNPKLAHETFLDHYTWPVHEASGKPLNWLLLPVADKLWRPGNATKGGFIQEFTGWKPSMLQPFVYLETLRSARAP